MVRLALVPSLDGALPGTVTNTAADLSSTQITDAIAEADAVIDGYLSGIYVTPVLAVETLIPHPVDYWSRDIAAYLATCTYRGQMDIQSTDPISLRYNAVMAFLKDVSTGKASLPLPRNTAGSDAAGNGAADSPINPYIGDLWDPSDFSLYPAYSPALGGPGWGPYWGPW
jgi:phage gp36-like protein